MTVVIDIKIKKMVEGTFRKYTKDEMVNILLRPEHAELLQEIYEKSFFIDSVHEAAEFLTDALIEEGLDVDTLEPDEDRKKRLPPEPEYDNKSLWDKLSEEI